MSNEMAFCTQCGKQINVSDKFCPHCGATQQNETTPLTATNSPPQTTNNDAIPDGVKGWSWGAFLLNWIWAIGNKTWIGLLALIPVVNIVMIFILGFKGREWAWKNNTWRDLEHFNKVQRKWSIAGFIVLAIAVPLWLVIGYQEYKHEISSEESSTSADNTYNFDEPFLTLPKNLTSINKNEYKISYIIPKMSFEPEALYALLNKSNQLGSGYFQYVKKFITSPDYFVKDCIELQESQAKLQGFTSEAEEKTFVKEICNLLISYNMECIKKSSAEKAATCYEELESGD